MRDGLDRLQCRGAWVTCRICMIMNITRRYGSAALWSGQAFILPLGNGKLKGSVHKPAKYDYPVFAPTTFFELYTCVSIICICILCLKSVIYGGWICKNRFDMLNLFSK